ncbi:hypothetical protein PR003_g29550 [Phytophthora rubi]|uniref:Uncharacterized protein n=1 Tax=Phytophthora rubi TaxID=129364 RepID=A0A6A4BGQ0_9STRA|nr:hypothetical protein PR003_g29550 [Phytophthora rubi]
MQRPAGHGAGERVLVFRHHRNVNNQRPAKHFAFFETLVEQLLVIDSPEAYATIEEATCAQERTAASPVRQASAATTPVRRDDGHRLEENPDTVDSDQGLKRRQRSCKDSGNAILRHLLQEHKIRNRPPPSRPGKKRRRRAAPSEAEEAMSDAAHSAGNEEEGMADDEA